MNQSYSNILEKNFSHFIDEIVKKILDYAKNNSGITSVLAIGSLAKNELRNFSNINLIFITEQPISELFTTVKELFSDKLAFSTKNSSKINYFVNYTTEIEARVIEFEITLKKSVSELHSMIIGSNLDISDTSSMVLLTKNDSTNKELVELLQENETYKCDVPGIINSYSSFFIEHFAKACFYMRKTDLYLYYNSLASCYATLVKLEAIKQDNLESFIHPRYALARIANLSKDFPFYRINLPNISISDKDLRLEYIFQFNYLLRKLKEKYNLEIDLQEIESFLKKLDKEVYFWNLRDIAYLDMEHLKPNVFYRSSTLTRYKDQRELKQFFDSKYIKTIIDLRSEVETLNSNYADIEGIKYINVPIGEKPGMDVNKLKYISPSSFNLFYEMFLRFHQDEIKKIFHILASEEGAFVLHCYAGRDRTGLVVALLLELLGEHSDIITEGLILEDYLNTGNNTSQDVFNIYRKTLDEFGGAKNYLLKEIGLSQKNIDKLVAKFIK